MNYDELRKKEKYSVTHSNYSFGFDAGYENWTEFMTALGKQLDKLKVTMKEVAKVEWEDNMIKLQVIKLYVSKGNCLERIN